MFYKQMGSPGIGKLIIDNFAKNPYIYKPSSTSEEFDVMTHGKIFKPWTSTKYDQEMSHTANIKAYLPFNNKLLDHKNNFKAL